MLSSTLTVFQLSADLFLTAFSDTTVLLRWIR
ncbi:hypothetical protein OESDEN_00684 [Oesophagostomum dentatum]|uniref:Uncharacterized protein n=1 Tax=Oesophagostomum dentatum TaxID=61180 RepID=A0A0B1TP55_OESDE|nr:hypothetical protein OESDEN_00684 [Oesophagostomum dentatum]